MEPEVNFEPYVKAQRLPSPTPWAEYSALDAGSGRPVRLAVLWSAGTLPPERSRACLDWFAEAGYQAKRLASHGLATVISYRSTADAAWVATEVPAGNTLRNLLRDKGPMAVERAMEISSRVALTLADAHTSGWAHGFLNADSVWVDDDVVTVTNLGLAIASQAMYPDSAPYSTQRGFLCTDPRRRDMQCLGLLITEMVAGVLPDPVGVPRTDVFPATVPSPVVRRIRSLVNLQSEDALTAAEWAEYARSGEPEIEESPLPPKQDTRYYEIRPKGDVRWTPIVTAVALVIIAIALAGLWIQQLHKAPRTSAQSPAAAAQIAAPPTVAPTSPMTVPPPDALSRVQVGPIQPGEEAQVEERLRALKFKPWPKREGNALYLQVDALAIAANAEAEAETLRRQGFAVRVVK
ncbi:MAG TPA: hypothetical protein VGM51_11710 [Armatimonadota bacterium]|jgi:hypothetical protein